MLIERYQYSVLQSSKCCRLKVNIGSQELTRLSRINFEKLVKNFSAFYRTRKFIPIQSHMNLIHTPKC
jgi:hypothetical protein